MLGHDWACEDVRRLEAGCVALSKWAGVRSGCREQSPTGIWREQPTWQNSLVEVVLFEQVPTLQKWAGADGGADGGAAGVDASTARIGGCMASSPHRLLP